jgi:hypothetical protein
MTAVLAALLAGPLLVGTTTRRVWSPDVALWFAGGALAYVAGLRFLSHYAFQLLPPLALVAMGGLAVPGWRRRAGVAPTAATSMVWLAAGTSAAVSADRYELVAGYVRSITTADEPVFVWGQSSEIYWQSDRLPASRFPHIQFLTNLTPRPGDTGERQPDYVTTAASWRDLWEDFATDPPAVIADTTARNGGSIANARLDRSPLWPYVVDHYRLVDSVDGVAIWRRVATSPAVPRAGRLAA